MWTCGFLPRWKKRWSCKLWFLVCLNTQMHVHHSEIQQGHLCDCRDMWELHKQCVLQTKFVRSLFWGLWAEITGEGQVGSTVHCCCLQKVSCDSFLSPVVLPLHFSGEFCFSNAAGKQSLGSESTAEPLTFWIKESGVAEFFVHLIEKADFQRWLQNSICASDRPPPSHTKCVVLHSDKLIKSDFLEIK